MSPVMSILQPEYSIPKTRLLALSFPESSVRFG